jgi:hypothetical protein
MSERERDAEEAADTGFGEEEDDIALEEEGPWELDPNDPTHPDYDLSEAAGYSDWEPSRGFGTLWRPIVLVVSLLIILALVLLPLIRFLYG